MKRETFVRICMCLVVALPFSSIADDVGQPMSRQDQLLQLREQQMKYDAEIQAQRNQRAAQPNQVSGQSQYGIPSSGRHSPEEMQRQEEERRILEQKRNADAEIQKQRLQLWADQQKADEAHKAAEEQKRDAQTIGTYFTESWHQEEWFTTLPQTIQDNYITAYKNGYVSDRDMCNASNLEIINHERVQARGMGEYAALIRGQASFPPKPHRRENMERRKNAPPPVAMNTAQADAVQFPESILSFTLGMKYDDFMALSKNNNYQISDLDADSSHLMGMMGANQHSSPLDDNYWKPSGISRPFSRNSKPNCNASQVNATFVNTLGANRFEVGFLEGRMVGMAIVYQTGSGYISALYNKICTKYPIIASAVTDDHMPNSRVQAVTLTDKNGQPFQVQAPMSNSQPSALLDMKGHSFLVIQTSFSVVIINVPLIKSIDAIKGEQKQRQEQMRQNQINQDIDSLFDGSM